jgi:hypothetical protein
MTMISANGPETGKTGVARAEHQGDTLKANFGLRGVYTLNPLGDGLTALVRLQAPFNDNTASYRRTNTAPIATKSAR